jgi:hypothetical protein
MSNSGSRDRYGREAVSDTDFAHAVGNLSVVARLLDDSSGAQRQQYIDQSRHFIRLITSAVNDGKPVTPSELRLLQETVRSLRPRHHLGRHVDTQRSVESNRYLLVVELADALNDAAARPDRLLGLQERGEFGIIAPQPERPAHVPTPTHAKLTWQQRFRNRLKEVFRPAWRPQLPSTDRRFVEPTGEDAPTILPNPAQQRFRGARDRALQQVTSTTDRDAAMQAAAELIESHSTLNRPAAEQLVSAYVDGETTALRAGLPHLTSVSLEQVGAQASRWAGLERVFEIAADLGGRGANRSAAALESVAAEFASRERTVEHPRRSNILGL